jgi:tetratricopeptide (TPR) repeat protein
VDGRLGNGLIVFICILFVTIIARSFIKDDRDMRYTLFSFMAGFFLNNILSFLSFLGVNVWGLIPVYRDLHQFGLPILRSAKVHILVNIINLIFCIGLAGEHFIQKGKETKYILAIIFGSASIINIWLFSIKQGFNLLLVTLFLLILFSLLVLKRIKLQVNVSKNIFLLCIIVILAVLIPAILLHIPAVLNLVIPDSMDLVSQVSLGSDVSWIIAASVFVESFVRGIFGVGVDAFSTAYYLYKPLNVNLLAFNQVTFYYAGSEVFTQFANGGLAWFLVWLFLGFSIVKVFITDLRNIKSHTDHSNSWRLLIINLSLLTIYISSYFVTYSVIVVFLLLTLVSLRAITKDILKKGTEDRFVIKLWAANLNLVGQRGRSGSGLNTFVTILMSVITIAIFGVWISKGIASAYALKAESFFVEQNKKYQGDVYPTIEEREAFVASMAHFYSKAVDFDRNNPLYNRRKGSMYLERVGIAAEKYSKSEEDENNQDLIRNVGTWRNAVIDSTRKSIDISPNIYANWEARARIYMGLVGMGFYDYTADAVFSLERALELNPLNFELHYSMAQISVIKGEKDNALASLTKVLSINPQHIPSILLAGDLNKERGNMDIYESYLKAAKKILETQGNTNVDVYTEITKQLNAISKDTEPTDSQTQEEVSEDQEDPTPSSESEDSE